MSYCQLKICVIVITGLTLCSPMSIKQNYHETLHNSMKAKCGAPVPKVFNVRELVEVKNANFFPECVVLHRCGTDTGCCPHGKYCGPSNMSEVELTFKEVDTVSKKPFRHYKYWTKVFDNHTECACFHLPK